MRILDDIHGFAEMKERTRLRDINLSGLQADILELTSLIARLAEEVLADKQEDRIQIQGPTYESLVERFYSDALSYHRQQRAGNLQSDFTDIGPECFAGNNDTVISWKGENFYKACDAVVVSHTLDGGRTHCVKRVGHPGEYHEDFDGNVIISFQALVEVKNATFKVGEMCSVHSLVHNFSLPNDEGWYVCVPGGVVTKDGWFSEVDDSNG